MFIEERHQTILDLLRANGSVTTGEIQEKFGISYDSAKRDLRILEEKGLLKRTHGGAIPARKVGCGGECRDMSSRERIQEVKANYLEIARKAASMIENSDVVYLTNASVGCLVAQNLPEELICTIVTNSISIAEELRRYENVTVIATGGEMSKSGAFYDAFTLETINRLRFDKCLITSAAVSIGFGLSIQKTRSVALTNAIINNSKTVIGLYPTNKIGFDSIVSICPASKLDILITDWDASEEDLIAFEEQGIKTVVVENEQ